MKPQYLYTESLGSVNRFRNVSDVAQIRTKGFGHEHFTFLISELSCSKKTPQLILS